MIVRAFVPAALAMLCMISSGAFARQPPQGSEMARNAFPVPATVRVVRDVVYAEYGERRLKLDVYVPTAAGLRTAAPGILVVRGGGWRSGDKEAFGFIAGQLAKEGFVAASIEYRTSAEAKFPAAVHDVKAAVRWMRAYAATYGVNPGAIGAIGGSAGAHLVAMLATSGGVKDLEGPGGNSATSSQVQAVVAMACVCNLDAKGPAVAEFIGEPLEAHADAIRAASPVTYLTDLITERSVRFIEENAKRPFFVDVAYNAAHWPYQRPDMPSTARDRARHLGPFDDSTSTRADYVAMLERADQGIGRILEALDKSGLRQNTIVIFTNDNGGEWLSRNTPLFHHKGTDVGGRDSGAGNLPLAGSASEGPCLRPDWSHHGPDRLDSRRDRDVGSS